MCVVHIVTYGRLHLRSRMGFKPKDPDDGSDIMTCGNCGKNSQWVYGPGLFIHVDDMAVKQN